MYQIIGRLRYLSGRLGITYTNVRFSPKRSLDQPKISEIECLLSAISGPRQLQRKANAIDKKGAHERAPFQSSQWLYFCMSLSLQLVML
jgi:hypothetical protein